MMNNPIYHYSSFIKQVFVKMELIGAKAVIRVIIKNISKKLYRRLILGDLIFGSKSSLLLLLLYIMLWRVLYSITKIGQLKTNIPIFLGLLFLLLLTFIYIFIIYRSHMKKHWLFQAGSQLEINGEQLVVVSSHTGERHIFSMENLKKMKENKKWYFLYYDDHTFIPISKLSHEHLPIVKTMRPLYWKWTGSFLLFITIAGVYFVGSNAVHFNGVLAWKINELKTDTKIKLSNENFYKTKLGGIMDSVKAEMELEPYLMTDDLKIEFQQDGTITSIETYIYGFDQNKKLQSGYLIYFDITKDKKVTVHKQDWKGQGTTIYDHNNDLSIVLKMLKWIPVKEEVTSWNEEKYAVLYKGIRTWTSLKGIRFIDEHGKINNPYHADIVNSGPTISLYIPGKEELITPQRYVYKPYFGDE
jgi:hypothetical protein